MGADVDVGHVAPQHLAHGGKLLRDGILFPPDHVGHVLDGEQLLRDDLSLADIGVVDMDQAGLADGDPAAGQDVVLDGDVVPVVLLHVGRAFHLVQVEPPLGAAEDVRLHEHVVVGKGRLVEDLGVPRDLLPGPDELLILGEPGEGDLHPAGKQQARVHADLRSGLPQRQKLRRRLAAQLRVMLVQIEGFGALEPPHVEGLAQVDVPARGGHPAPPEDPWRFLLLRM